MAFGDPIECDTQAEAERIFGERLHWVYEPAVHRLGLRALFDHGPRWAAVGVLGLHLAHVPAPTTPALVYDSAAAIPHKRLGVKGDFI